MGEGWSVARRDLIPSNSPVNHFDRRMHLQIGAGDLDPHNITHRDWRKPLSSPEPREATDRELLAIAKAMARDALHAKLDEFLARAIAELRAGK